MDIVIAKTCSFDDVDEINKAGRMKYIVEVSHVLTHLVGVEMPHLVSRQSMTTTT